MVMMPMMVMMLIGVVGRRRPKVRQRSYPRQRQAHSDELRRRDRLKCSTKKAQKCEKIDGEFHSNPTRFAHRLSWLWVVSTCLIYAARISPIINRSDRFGECFSPCAKQIREFNKYFCFIIWNSYIHIYCTHMANGATKLVKLYTVYHKLQFLLSYIEGRWDGGRVKGEGCS